ncbi:PhzF family phenazine biosynthesis protein [Vibrio ishigakensis]|uniref:PhzF family phenazine biosynthesis protein n=1 Tax=Vibrio ishigakensis TaxID=1481914 RepID=UPI0021C352C4|nr:PhzF family phenazine biosynthesis protein [Vibrio ishigakensis]
MNIETYQVDAFTNQAFAGNPAAVCITKEPLSSDLMLNIAAEMAVSETAFLSLSDMNLKWFTPEIEVALCGHGTLATVEVLRSKGTVSDGEAVIFNTLSGVLKAKVIGDEITLDFPAPVIDFEAEPSIELIHALGIASSAIEEFAEFDTKQLIVLSTESDVLSVKPNFDLLKQMPGRGVAITATSDQSELDYVSRYFAPWVGVNEDPVTGSAHCALTKYWSGALNQKQFKAFQASRRGGYLETELLGDRVLLTGHAKLVLSGTLHL